MIPVLVLVLVAVAAEALPYYPGRVSQFGGRPDQVAGGYGLRKSPLNQYPGGNEEEVQRWLRLVGPHSSAPSNYVQDRAGPSIYDDYLPTSNRQSAASRTLWFDEFPHRRAVLNWQEKRRQQGLPIYKLLSQRPGFAFYQGN